MKDIDLDHFLSKVKQCGTILVPTSTSCRRMCSPSKERYWSEFLENMVILLVTIQLRSVLGHQSLGQGIPAPQIKIIGVPCPVIEKFMINQKKYILMFTFETILDAK